MTTIQHPDHVRLLAIADLQDAQAEPVDTSDPEEVNTAVERLLGPLADVKSVRAVATERTDPILEDPLLLLAHPRGVLRGVWQDGFSLGVLFQQHGGHHTA
jgi:hypothetical protein